MDTMVICPNCSDLKTQVGLLQQDTMALWHCSLCQNVYEESQVARRQTPKLGEWLRLRLYDGDPIITQVIAISDSGLPIIALKLGWMTVVNFDVVQKPRGPSWLSRLWSLIRHKEK